MPHFRNKAGRAPSSKSITVLPISFSPLMAWLELDKLPLFNKDCSYSASNVQVSPLKCRQLFSHFEAVGIA